MKTVLITGASGFIARAAAAALTQDPVCVIGLSRTPVALPEYARVYAVPLLTSMRSSVQRESIDVVIHCANHAGRGEYAVNVEGTRQWMQEAAEQGATLQILISSLSADERAPAPYGQAKWALEQTCAHMDGVSLRLGIVIGNGGMFRKLQEPMRRAPVIPLLDGGRSLVYVLGIAALTGMLRRCVLEEGAGFRGRVLHAQQPQPHRLFQILDAIRKHYRYSCRFLPVPSLPVLWALTAAERIPGLRLPISSSNIRGLRQSRDKRFPSDFRALGGTEETLDALVAVAAAGAS